MKFEKSRFNRLLGCWIKWDGKMIRELCANQRKLLFDRIVLELSADKLAKAYKSTPAKIRETVQAILDSIDRTHGRELAEVLREINAHLEDRERGKKERREQTFDFERIFLN